MNRDELRQRIAVSPIAVRFAELEQLLLAFAWRFQRSGKGDLDSVERTDMIIRRPYLMDVCGDRVEGYLTSAPELPGRFTAGTTPRDAIESATIASE